MNEVSSNREPSVSAPVVLVSGGSRGLGEAIVRHLLHHGYCVATCSRKRSSAIQALSTDPQANGRFMYAEVDVCNEHRVREFVQQVHSRFQRLDGLVNNAAWGLDGVLPLTSDHDLSRAIDINLRAAIGLARECVRLMLVAGGGSVVNVSSIVAQRGFAGLSVYAATKSGLEGFTRALARELGPRNIRVNAVAPGFLETEMSAALSDRQRSQIIRRTPLGRLGSVDDVVPCIEFLLSPASRFVTGHVLTVDGGASV